MLDRIQGGVTYQRDQPGELYEKYCVSLGHIAMSIFLRSQSR